jgi:tetratricopeptide (TPR) repeat protein
MGLFGLFGKKKQTLEQANEANKDFTAKNPVPQDEEKAMIREASGALTSGNFEKAITLYSEMADKYPANKGLYLSQVGAAYYFLEDYNKAIEYYVTAKNEGADAGMMDDNIWEACETIYNKTKDNTAIEKYLEYYPEGNYAKKAKKILS